MAWTYTEVFSVAAAGLETKSMTTHGGKIWAVTNEAHPVSGNSGRIYYSSDGDAWTEDVAWTGPSDIGQNAYLEGQIFVHQGFLHLITNLDRGGANQGRLYRRQDGTWVQLHGEATEKVYNWAYSNDTWIVIAGTDFTAVNGGRAVAFISVWNGSSMTEEFRGAASGYPYDQFGLGTVYYNGEWYAFTTRWLDVSTSVDTLRYRGDGTWPIFRNYSGSTADINSLTVSSKGLFWGEDLWKTSGEWINTAFPGTFGRSGYQRGMMIGARTTGYLYVYSTPEGVWWSQGRPASDADIYALVYHNGQLYAGGSRASGPEIWRITLYHKTIAGYWQKPTAHSLVCDHEFGDTIYFGIYTIDGWPCMMKIDDDLEDWYQLYFTAYSSGSFIQVQTALERNVAYAFGYLNTDEQIVVTPDAGGIFYDADDDWGEDKITTMEYLPTAGSDLTITNYEDEDLLRTTSGSASWTKRGDVPGAPLSQVRDGDNIFVGCTAGSANLYLSTDIGQTYTVKGTGLPINVDILDLELA